MKTELNPSQSDYDDKFNDIVGTPDMQSLDNQGNAIARDHDGEPLSNSKSGVGANPLAKAEKDGNKNKSNRPSSLADAEAKSSFPYKAGSVGAATGFSLGVASQTVLKGVSRNKFKLLGGGGIAGIIVAAVVFGSTLILPTITNNAEKRLSGASNLVLDNYNDGIFRKAIKKVGRKIIKSRALNAQVDEFGKVLRSQGYELVDDATLKLPSGELIEGRSAVTSELKSVAKSEFGTSWRKRSSLAKAFRNRATIPTTSPTEIDVGTEPVADEVDTIAKARKAVATPDKLPDDVMPQYKNASDELDPEISEEAKKTKDEALEDGSKQVDDVVSDVAEEGLEGASKSAAAEEATQIAKGGALSKLSLSSYLSQEVCGVGRKLSLAVGAAVIAKKVNLIRLAGVVKNVVGAQITGSNSATSLNDLMGVIQTNPKSGKGLTQSAGVGWLMGNAGPKPTEGELSVFGAGPADIGPFFGFLLGIYTQGFVRTTCNFARSPQGQAALTLVELGGAVATGGGFTISVQALKTALSQGIKASIPYIAGSIGFYFIGQFLASYIQKSATGMLFNFNKNEGGPPAGNAIASGLGAEAELAGRSQGMKPIGKVAYARIMDEVYQERRQEYAQKSLFDRFVRADAEHTDSLLSLALTTTPISSPTAGGVVRNTIAQLTNQTPINQMSSER